MTLEFCSDFYPTPTDQGICQTKNLKLDDLVSISDEFTSAFETNKEKMPLLINGDRLKAKATFIVDTNSGDEYKNSYFSWNLKSFK